MAKPAENLLHYAASETDADMYYATRFLAPDAFAWFRTKGRDWLVASDLEIGRAREEASVDGVLSLTDLRKRAEKSGVKRPGMPDILAAALRLKKVRSVEVPDQFPLGMADALRGRGIKVTARRAPFLPARVLKTPAEVKAIRECQEATERAVHRAFDRLRKARILGNSIVEKGGRRLTAEDVKRTIDVSLMEDSCIAKNTIVACGDQAVDPHNRGTGYLRPHQAIVFDVFPRSARTGYYSDMSRTVVKGRASEALRRQYAAVLEGQEMGIGMIRAGVNGREVHQAIHRRFEEQGYRTGPRNGKMQGFFHGTGHGVGLDIHEAPRVGGVDDTLPAGSVVTVEPGLYYPGVGGVRLEDMVLVQERGCRNLTVFEKTLVL
ncbi:MAG: aminopeptidase P family protein [Planctomycetaceae bacterium]|nr:Xaa-Pro peptidase family protein [Planctomycetota bacterium]NUN52359.1 aminopeptidase P family protein [Planctomycetaceae bacterium]